MSDDRFDKLENRLQEIHVAFYEKLSELSVSTAENTTSLKEHMRRSDALEKSNVMLAELIDLTKQEIEKQIKPMETFIDRIKFLGWVVGVSSSAILALEKLGILSRLFG